MTYLRFPCCFLIMVFLLGTARSPLAASSHHSLHDVYLANTEHELHIYRIYGKAPGKTLMLIGGIQGDEPGGYLTADLYADISLQKGNLIVVPRANFYSILLNQRDGMSGDMNRKFSESSQEERNMEQEIVAILKKLIGEADCLLNLHEGSGFYSDQWISDIENPDRFGQSIIYDAATYIGTKNHHPIALHDMAAKVVDKVNRQIDDPRHLFRTNNHDTVSATSRFPEQRKSATYYALTQENIPAFGIETSKSIKLNSTKVALQKLVVNAFMEEFGVIPETPGLHVEDIRLDYVLVKVNDGHPYAVPNGSELRIGVGDEVMVTDIVANFNRGLTADFVGMGSHNDTKLPFRIAEPTKVLIRKDAEICGSISLATTTATAMGGKDTKRNEVKTAQTAGNASGLKAEAPLSELRALQLLVNVDGTLMTVDADGEIEVQKSKLMVIKGVHSNISRLDKQILVNLKGFSPQKHQNIGNDINFPFSPERDLWSRFSEDKKGIRYPIEATYNNRVIGNFWLKVK
jgi:predicted deacylase